LRGNELIGPAVVEEAASTTVVGIGDEVTVDEWGNLLIKIAP
jgi:N-methylhydantoinase A